MQLFYGTYFILSVVFQLKLAATSKRRLPKANPITNEVVDKLRRVSIANRQYQRVFKRVIGERAKRARHYQGCTNSSWCGTYIYIYIYVWRYVCHISSACHVYVMWAELGHSHFLYVPAVSNVVTNGSGTGTKNVLKGTVRLGLSLVSSLLSTAQLLFQSSVYGATTVAKVSLFSTWTRCAVSFYSM